MEAIGLQMFMGANQRLLDFSYSNLNEVVNNSLKNHKELSPYVMQYIIITGDISILENPNFLNIAKQIYANTKDNARVYIMNVLKDFESYDKEELTISLSNQFELSEKEINGILKSLEKDKKIKINKKTIDLV